MSRDTGRNLLRSHIAYLAARIMAEDGIDDHALAKRKAARQAGAAGHRELPDNDEIDAALASYRELYQRDAHHDRLRALREIALAMMRELAQFNPHLTGPVLKGSAGKYAGIELQLFTDNAKGVELFMLARGAPYRLGAMRLYPGDQERNAPVYTINRDGVDVEITLLAAADVRVPVKTSPAGRAMERARLDAVEALLAAT